MPEEKLTDENGQVMLDNAGNEMTITLVDPKPIIDKCKEVADLVPIVVVEGKGGDNV